MSSPAAHRAAAPEPEQQPLPEIRPWSLEVESVTDLTPQLRLIRLSGSELAAFEHVPGQDMMLELPAAGRPVRRRYTIRSFDRRAGLLDLIISMHGTGPGLRWASAVRPGDKVHAIGPRGKITLVGNADWHIFAGDETHIAACFSLLHALPRDVPGLTLLQIDGNFDEQVAVLDSMAPREIVWVDGEAARAGGTTLIKALRALDLPLGRGHAYLGGEVGLVVASRNALLERGLAREQVSAKAYWNLGQGNLDKGEPERRAS
jgi:NADPH-dependent ferric siderophore reductase